MIGQAQEEAPVLIARVAPIIAADGPDEIPPGDQRRAGQVKPPDLVPALQEPRERRH